jgi:hypothetical protein
MPADESTAEVSRLLDQWDSVTRSQPQLNTLLAADHVDDMGKADGDTHLVAILARYFNILLLYLSSAYGIFMLWLAFVSHLVAVG